MFSWNERVLELKVPFSLASTLCSCKNLLKHRLSKICWHSFFLLSEPLITHSRQPRRGWRNQNWASIRRRPKEECPPNPGHFRLRTQGRELGTDQWNLGPLRQSESFISAEQPCSLRTIFCPGIRTLPVKIQRRHSRVPRHSSFKWHRSPSTISAYS